MLEHSRGVTGERREVDLNGLIDEALNLAYHNTQTHDRRISIQNVTSDSRKIHRRVFPRFESPHIPETSPAFNICRDSFESQDTVA